MDSESLVVGFPVLRLRGDYLAIVTLAFGEITRIVLLNWSKFTKGPEGVAGIPRATDAISGLTLQNHTRILYFIILAMVVFSIFVIRRLENSRLGRAWEAMREDEIACQSMGIDLTKTKLTAFALGAVWAGFVGVIFATKTTYVNPNMRLFDNDRGPAHPATECFRQRYRRFAGLFWR